MQSFFDSPSFSCRRQPPSILVLCQHSCTRTHANAQCIHIYIQIYVYIHTRTHAQTVSQCILVSTHKPPSSRVPRLLDLLTCMCIGLLTCMCTCVCLQINTHSQSSSGGGGRVERVVSFLHHLRWAQRMKHYRMRARRRASLKFMCRAGKKHTHKQTSTRPNIETHVHLRRVWRPVRLPFLDLLLLCIIRLRQSIRLEKLMTSCLVIFI